MTHDTHAHDTHERAAVGVGMNAPQGDAFDESLHALPGWFAWFQKTFGLSFLVLASAYLLGKLATLGWVPDINTPTSWGVFDGAGEDQGRRGRAAADYRDGAATGIGRRDFAEGRGDGTVCCLRC